MCIQPSISNNVCEILVHVKTCKISFTADLSDEYSYKDSFFYSVLADLDFTVCAIFSWNNSYNCFKNVSSLLKIIIKC